jgi:hypothetical protein
MSFKKDNDTHLFLVPFARFHTPVLRLRAEEGAVICKGGQMTLKGLCHQLKVPKSNVIQKPVI